MKVFLKFNFNLGDKVNNTKKHVCIESACTHCACHNPILDIFSKYFKNDEEIIEKIMDGFTESCKSEDNYKVESVLYHGGTIRPMINNTFNTVEAIGFLNGKVIAVGTKKDVEKEMNKKINDTPYDTILLKDKQTLLPGLIDPHVHILPTAITMGDAWCNLSAFDKQNKQRILKKYDLEYVKKALKDKDCKLIYKSSWLLGQGIDPAFMPFISPTELTEITVDFLDKLKIGRPIFLLSASMHTAYVNTLALNSIYDKIKKPLETKEEYIKRIKKQGALQEFSEMSSALTAIPLVQKLYIFALLFRNIKNIFETAVQRGITLINDAGMTDRSLRILKIYRDFHPHNVRIGYAKIYDTVKDAKKIDSFERVKDIDKMFQTAVKLVSDGSNQGLTGFQNDSYACKVKGNNTGIFNFTNPPLPIEKDKADYKEMAKIITDKGWPMMIHANGDKAIDLTLDVYEYVLKGETGLNKRHRIEHCSLLNEKRMDRMQQMGISPSFLIGHVGYWGYAFDQVIFKEKAQELDLCKSMLDRKLKITFHSDLGVSPIGPLRYMEQAVTRIMEHTNGKDIENPILNEKERITRKQALTAITRDAAWQCHVDDFVGDLDVGKYADYIILEEDPLSEESMTAIRDIKVLETWIGGRKRYLAN